MGKKYVIIGGVAGGATAAAKIRREDEKAEIVVFERGPYVSFANCGLPYYIGGDIKNRDDLLLMTPDSFWEKYRIQVHTQHEVLTIAPEKNKIKIKDPQGKEFAESYDTLILSQGAQPFLPPLPGIEMNHVMSLRNVPDMDRITQFISTKKPKTAVVVGGGFIGLEMAEAFHHCDIDVTVVELMPHVLPPLDQDMALLFTETILRNRFNIITNTAVAEIKNNSVILKDGTEIAADIVLVSAGVKPEIEMAKAAGITLGESGGIKVNGQMQTNYPNVYAVGDAVEIKNRITNQLTRIPLAGPANRQGRIAAINATGGNATYKGSIGTAIVKVFEQNAGMTGLSEKAATKAGLDAITSMTSGPNHAGYYPGAKTVITKLVYENKSGQLLGAQVIGGSGVDKRLDVLATAIHAKMTVHDLEEIDLAYAPPFGSANDPVNIAGFVATHIVKGEVKDVQKQEDMPKEAQLIDVRNASEIETTGILKGAIHIPLPQLRENISSISPDKPVVFYCAKGLRGYLALRILKGNGFEDVTNISGGFTRAIANGWELE